MIHPSSLYIIFIRQNEFTCYDATMPVKTESRSSKYETMMLIYIITFIVLMATSILYYGEKTMGWFQPDPQELMIQAYPESQPTIVFTNDFINCGAVHTGAGGCFHEEDPEYIYVSPNVTYPIMKYIVLHELGHYVQYQENLEFSECAADEMALKWGADISFSGYQDKC